MFQYTEKVRKAVKSFKESRACTRYKSHACTWGYVVDGELTVDGTHYCHDSLSRQIGTGIENADYILNSIQYISAEHNGDDDADNYIEEEIGKSFYHWLVNESPYCDAFISKDVERIWKDKTLIVTLDVHYNLMCSALIACRAVSEHSGSIAYTWWKLVNLGVDKTIAFALSHIVIYKEESFSWNINIRAWHVSLSGNMSVNNLINFYNFSPDKEEIETYRTERKYNNISYFFLKKRYNNLENRCYFLLKDISEKLHLKGVNKLFFPKDTWFFNCYINENDDDNFLITDEVIIEFNKQVKEKINA